MPAARLVVLAGVLLALAGARCGPPALGVVLDTPFDGLILDDPSPSVTVSGRLGKNFLIGTIDVLVDEVPLAATLGLAPPFADESGVVVLASGPVTISGFEIQGISTRRVALQIDGLAAGSHHIELQGSTAQLTASDTADVHLVGPMTLAAEGFAAAGLLFGPATSENEGELANATLGQAAAEGSVPFASGDELRAGFVPVAEAIIVGSAP